MGQFEVAHKQVVTKECTDSCVDIYEDWTWDEAKLMAPSLQNAWKAGQAFSEYIDVKPLNVEELAKDLAEKIEHFRCLGMVNIPEKYVDRVKQTEEYELAGHAVSEARRILAEARSK